MGNDLDARSKERAAREGLADYRADRDDFPRLLYLVFQEIQAQKQVGEASPRE